MATTSSDEPSPPQPTDTEFGDATALPVKQSRNRSVASCIECYRRKQKCNRKWPCNHCLDRKVGHLCQFNTIKGAVSARKRIKDKTIKKVAGTTTNDNEINDISVRSSHDASTFPRTNNSSRQFLLSQTPEKLTDHLCTEENFLDSLGYSGNDPGNLLGYLKNLNVSEDHEASHKASSGDVPIYLTLELSDALKQMPDRAITDILIQHFLSEANWLYEMIYPTTFLERYNAWWSRPCQTLDELEFAVLLLRLCAYSSQFLPSKNYTAETILSTPIGTIREQDKPSITCVHQLFFAACYLKNEGKVKESWNMLGEAIREAYDMGLHLDVPRCNGKTLSQYELEMGKRTYWYLWLWDNDIQNPTSTDDAPYGFCERVLQIKLTKLTSELLSSNGGKPSSDPVTTESHIRRLQEFIDLLPPAFGLVDPDRRWDTVHPAIERQREMLKISVYASICFFLRPFVMNSTSRRQTLTRAEGDLIAKHRLRLVNTIVALLDSVARLHDLMGGKQNRFFMLSFLTLEPAALLAVYLISSEANATTRTQRKKKNFEAEDVLKRKYYWEKLEEALGRLEMLSEVSSIARNGVKLLKKLMAKSQKQDLYEDSTDSQDAKRVVPSLPNLSTPEQYFCRDSTVYRSPTDYAVRSAYTLPTTALSSASPPDLLFDDHNALYSESTSSGGPSDYADLWQRDHSHQDHNSLAAVESSQSIPTYDVRTEPWADPDLYSAIDMDQIPDDWVQPPTNSWPTDLYDWAPISGTQPGNAQSVYDAPLLQDPYDALALAMDIDWTWMGEDHTLGVGQ
ncbi:hypothetical protein MMC17_000312 [Xylographa soralifera]|nr:hypothetical protein [Xylographa soralifera]